MEKLNKEQLLKITGGGISATLLNALARGIDVFLDVGRSIGSAVRRIISGNKCVI